MASSIISIDWLQIFADMTHLNYADEFVVKTLDYGTKHFEILEEIYLQNSLFCIIQRQPRSEILKPYSGIIKFDNSLLYYKNAEDIINNFLKQNEIHMLSITRLDIAVDFKKFKNGLLPQNLIKGFMREKFLKNGRGKYTIIGEQRNVIDVGYLRFGTRASSVNVILYNKSLEMREKTHKMYISETWKKLEGSPMQDVWRIEFSLKAKATMFLNEPTGEMVQIGLNILTDNELKKLVVSSLEKRYFEFKINNGTKNKTRMERLTLLDYDESDFTNRYYPVGSDVLKKDKIFIKRLYVLDKEFRDLPDYVIESRELLLEYMLKNQYLERYLENKAAEWDQIKFRN